MSDFTRKSGDTAEAAVTIFVCSSCRNEAESDERPRPGELLGNRVKEKNRDGDIEVVQIECLANCKRRLSAAMTRPGGWSYVFGGLTLANDGDLIEGARLFRDSPIPWRGRPECLKRGLIARVPPLSINGNGK